MIRENFTQTPNILFDQLIKELNNSELKILLIIIRQTNGWIDKATDKRKVKDRITYSQFISKSGLSRRIISAAIKSLSTRKLIEITDHSGNTLSNANERKGQLRIYYSSLLETLQSIHILNQTSAKCDNNLCKNRHEPVQNMIHNKRNYIKINTSKEKDSDYKHIGEVIKEMKFKWNSK